ncbi:MAG: hypothetical protein JWM95_590 [Gemmatimonadetes bacterium]|nr:hypothetical protein [Gemmatimonadota bacterium]
MTPLRLRQQLAAFSPLSAITLAAAALTRLSGARTALEGAETLVAHHYDAQRAVLTDSGRSALQVAIELAVNVRGEERIVGLPAFQCFEVASAAVGAGCRIDFYDVDPYTLGPDLDSLERMLRRGVKVVVIAPLYGVPVAWDEVRALVDLYGARAIEDAAQGHGARWNGKRLGSLGLLSVVSFGRGKGWTGGAGGALLMRGDFSAVEPPMQHSAQEARIFAVTLVQWLAGRPWLYGLPASVPSLGLGETRYHGPTPPERMAAISASVVRWTHDMSAREAGVRRENAERWRLELPARTLAGLPHLTPGAVPGYLRLPIRLSPASAASASSGQAKRLGVARSYPVPLERVAEIAGNLCESRPVNPGADLLAARLVTLPTHSRLSEDDRRAIVDLCGGWTY